MKVRLPQGPFGAILADPPWLFSTWSAKGKGRSPDGAAKGGEGARHYGTMTLGQIVDMPVDEVAAKDCALFLWAIDSMLPEALRVGTAWGFTFKTVAFTWAKTDGARERFHMGMGYWTRGNPEQCLLFTRGKPKRLSASVRQLVVAPRREHSRKPDVVRNRIESLVAGPYLELFARSAAPGWEAWGNEVGKFAPKPAAKAATAPLEAAHV